MVNFQFSKIKNMDISVLLAILAVTLLSTATLTSAADGNLFPWAIKHMIRFIFGLVMLLLVTMADIRIWYSLAYPIYLCVLLLLITVEVKGHIGMGAQRWVDLYFFNLQPSELMKIAVVLALARYFHSMTYEDVGKIKQLIIPLLILTAPILLVLKQPDLGTAMIILATAASVRLQP